MEPVRKKAYRARWALAESGIIENALLALENDYISYIGPAVNADLATDTYEIRDLENSVLIPGLINAHTHTNFPQNKTVEFNQGSMVDWVRAAVEIRDERSESEQISDINSALKRLRETGTVALAEISNDLVSLEPIADSGLCCRYFCERFGFPPELADRTFTEVEETIRNAQASLAAHNTNQVTVHSAPHATYSTSAKLIQTLTEKQSVSSIHISENSEELALLQTGEGPWRARLREIERDNEAWQAPGVTPISYLAQLGALKENLLLVHAVHLNDEDIRLIKASAASVVLCPGSNKYIGTGIAPVKALHDANINLALGTDSLGSNTDLNLFAEMRELKKLAPEIPLESIWKMATTGGAKALGFADSLGELKVGAAPGLFAAQLDINSTAGLLEALVENGDQNLTPLHPARLR
jgi:cytosine/adenosine deaminase-related metal-dependent hydrolase